MTTPNCQPGMQVHSPLEIQAASRRFTASSASRCTLQVSRFNTCQRDLTRVESRFRMNVRIQTDTSNMLLTYE